MATITVCDGCSALDRQLIPVLGKDICPLCVKGVKAFLNARGRKRVRKGDWMGAMQRLCAVRGQCSSEELAAEVGQTNRAAYHWAFTMSRRGLVVRLGDAKFALPAAEAAE